MKKVFPLVLIIIIILALVICYLKVENTRILIKEGIEPYKLKESEENLLRSFGMDNNTQIINFHGPEEAITLNVNIYKLGDNKNWNRISVGSISIGEEREPTKELIGNFTMELGEDFSIDYNINSSGRASYKTDKILLDKEIVASNIVFLQEYEKIEINKEIPIGLMVYNSDTDIGVFSLQDFFKPSKFDGMELVQMVTLTFSDKEI